jgi:hypothetical protein
MTVNEMLAVPRAQATLRVGLHRLTHCSALPIFHIHHALNELNNISHPLDRRQK